MPWTHRPARPGHDGVRLFGLAALVGVALAGAVHLQGAHAAPAPPSRPLAGAPVTHAPVTPATVTAVRSALQIAAALRELAEELRPVSYRLPVDAPVVRPFEAPDPYGPGHRGVDLDAPPGSRGPSRGARPRASRRTGRRCRVGLDRPRGRRPDQLRATGPRCGSRPATRSRAVRSSGTSRPATTATWSATVGCTSGRGATASTSTRCGCPASVRRSRRSSVTAAGGVRTMLVTPYDAWGGGRLGGVLTTPSPRATAPGFAVPPNANHLVLVAGLSSTSRIEPLDPSHLGIAERERDPVLVRRSRVALRRRGHVAGSRGRSRPAGRAAASAGAEPARPGRRPRRPLARRGRHRALPAAPARPVGCDAAADRARRHHRVAAGRLRPRSRRRRARRCAGCRARPARGLGGGRRDSWHRRRHGPIARP
jgi:hypothetical protein